MTIGKNDESRIDSKIIALQHRISPESKILSDSISMFSQIRAEVKLVQSILERNMRSQEWRRIFIRTLFIYFEGCCYRMKQDALCFKRYSPEEKHLIDEVTLDLGADGKPRARIIHLRHEDNIKYAFRKLAEARGVDYELGIKTSGWQAYRDAIRIRNRITHPKNIADLEVSKEEMDLVLDAYIWFSKQYLDLLEIMRNAEAIGPGRGQAPLLKKTPGERRGIT